MAIDVSALTEYTFAEIKKASKHAMIRAAVGGANLSIAGRSFGAISLDEARSLYKWADEMEQTEANDTTGGMIALGKFGEPR